MTQHTGNPDNSYSNPGSDPGNGPGADWRGLGEDTTGENAAGAGTNARQVAAQVAEHARVYADKVHSAARNFKPFTERAMQERPLGTLAAAALIGFVLGALWKR
jgi:ElaB/YqjD/DUF883 family membrane-anchored ribosome-binding protein